MATRYRAVSLEEARACALPEVTDSEIAQLISVLLPQAELPAEIHAALLERAGGNPLYAEEFIRMLTDRGLLQPRGRNLGLDPEADIPMPDTFRPSSRLAWTPLLSTANHFCTTPPLWVKCFGREPCILG